jgi:N-acetylmuramoyl-L-alanine amidase
LIDPEKGIYLFDDLVVLKNADAPAVLLEAAVIVHPKDEKKASSTQYRNIISEAVMDMATNL